MNCSHALWFLAGVLNANICYELVMLFISLTKKTQCLLIVITHYYLNA
jgi:hypothetical protein